MANYSYKYKMIVRYRKDDTYYETYYFDNHWKVDETVEYLKTRPWTSPEVINVYINQNRNWKVYQKHLEGKLVVDNSMKF